MAMHAEGKLQRPAQAATTGWTMEAYQTAGVLLRAAQRWAKLAPSVMEELKSMRSMVRVPRGGLSNRVQDRLAELSSDEDRDDLYQLPGRAFERADRLLRDKDFRRAAKLDTSKYPPPGHGGADDERWHCLLPPVGWDRVDDYRGGAGRR